MARYIKFVHRTSWQTEAMTETSEQHTTIIPASSAMWHGEFMLLPLIKPPFIPVDIMLARHRDAEILGETLRHFDMQLIRGAGAASRAGTAAARTPSWRPCRRCATAARWP